MYGIEKTGWGKILTEKEILYETVSTKRLYEILDKRQVSIRRVKRDMNNYGEFLFISTKVGKQGITFYGAGFDEVRNRWITEEFMMFAEFVMYAHPLYNEYKPMNKKIAIEMIQNEVTKHRNYAENSIEGNQRNVIDDLIDVIGDENAFITEAEDNPELLKMWGV